MLKIRSYLLLTGEIEPGHGVAYDVASESSGSSCRSVHVPGPTGEFASNAWRGGGADYVVSSLGALEVCALSRLTFTFCHWDKERNSYTNYYN